MNMKELFASLLCGSIIREYEQKVSCQAIRIDDLKCQLERANQQRVEAEEKASACEKAMHEHQDYCTMLCADLRQAEENYTIQGAALDRVTKEKESLRLINEQICAERDQLAQKYKSEQKRSSSLMGTIRGLKHQIKKLEDGKA